MKSPLATGGEVFFLGKEEGKILKTLHCFYFHPINIFFPRIILFTFFFIIFYITIPVIDILQSKLIDVSLLSMAEVKWVDDYHSQVWEKVRPLKELGGG